MRHPESTLRPYRLLVGKTGQRVVGKGRRRRTVECGYGFVAWNPEQPYGTQARLPGAGSFTWPGVHAARAEAMRQLEAGADQVSIRTEQDKQVYRFFRQADGTISGYGGQE